MSSTSTVSDEITVPDVVVMLRKAIDDVGGKTTRSFINRKTKDYGRIPNEIMKKAGGCPSIQFLEKLGQYPILFYNIGVSSILVTSNGMIIKRFDAGVRNPDAVVISSSRDPWFTEQIPNIMVDLIKEIGYLMFNVESEDDIAVFEKILFDIYDRLQKLEPPHIDNLIKSATGVYHEYLKLHNSIKKSDDTQNKPPDAHLESLRNHVATLISQRDSLQTRYDSIKKECDTLRTQRESLQTEIESLRTAATAPNPTYDSELQREIKRLQEANTELKKGMTTIQAREHANKPDKLRREIADLKRERDKYAANLETLSLKNEENARKIVELENTNRFLTGEVSKMRTAPIDTNVTKMQLEYNQLRMEAEVTMRHLSMEIQRLTMDNQRLTTENKMISAELVKVQTMNAMNGAAQTAEIMKHFHNFMQGVGVSPVKPTPPPIEPVAVSPPPLAMAAPTLPPGILHPAPITTGSSPISSKSPLNYGAQPFVPSPSSVEQKKPTVTTETSIEDLIKNISWSATITGKSDPKSWTVDNCKW
jgi:uncharacterized coiled-coil DUF342 family protein